jgi:hypothetical protein
LDLNASQVAFPKKPMKVPGVFHLTFSAKVSPCFNVLIRILYIVQLWKTEFIILHFVYHDIDTAGCPAKLVYHHLRGFFKKPNAIAYKEIRFNIPDDDAMTAQAEDMKLLANELMK